MQKKENNDTKDRLENLGKKLVKEISSGENPNIDIPIRALSNVIFNKNKNYLTLGDKSSKRFFFNVAHVRKFVQTIEVAAVSKDLLEMKKTASLRDVFYQLKRTIPGTKINIVDEQTETDKCIEDLELVTNSLREQLNINANKNGSVAGKVVIEDKGDDINWAKLGSGGWSIPSNVENIKFKKVNAKFVIYMEKAAIWERLHEDKVWDKLDCIILSSQGQTTRGIRRLLQRLYIEHKLPVFVLTDFDSWGLYIYSVIKHGSINLAHQSERFALPRARFLGITGDDIEKYNLKKHIIKATEHDKKRLAEISKYEWFKNNKEWQKQFKIMKDMDGKVEIQALSSRGITFISDTYLPEKIKNKDWIE